MNAEIYLVSRTWFASVDGQAYPLTRQDLMEPLRPGRYPALVDVVGRQAELRELRLKPSDFNRATRRAA